MAASGLLATVLSLQGALGGARGTGFSGAGNAMAASFEKANLQLQELHATAARPINITMTGLGAGGLPGGGAAVAAGAAGRAAGGTDYLGRSMFKTGAYLALYAGFAAVNQAKDADYTLRRAAVIQGVPLADVQAAQRSLQERFYMNAADAADLQLAASQMKYGVLPQGRTTLEQAGAALHVVYPELSAAESAQTVYRLALTTAHGTEEQKQAYIERQMENSDRIASAILKIGEQSAGGPVGTLNMLSRLEAAGSLTALDEPTLIALSGALSSIDPQRAGTAAGAIERLMGKNLYGNAKIASYLNSIGATQELRVSDPAAFLAKVAQGVSGTGAERAQILTEAGIVNVRDLTLVSDLAQTSGMFTQNLKDANAEMESGTFLQKQVNEYYGSLKGDIDRLKSSFSELALTLVYKFGPAVAGAAGAVASGLQGASASPFIVGVIGLGAGALLLRKLYRGALAHEMFTEEGIAKAAGMTPEALAATMESRAVLRSAVASGEVMFDPAVAALANLAEQRGETFGAKEVTRLGEMRLAASATLRRFNPRIGFGSARDFAGRVANEEEEYRIMTRLVGEPAAEVGGARSFFGRLAGRIGKFGGRVEGSMLDFLAEGAEKKGLGTMAARLGARSALFASTAEIPILDILTGLAALAPILGGIANWLDKIGKKGGIVGIIANGFGILFHTLELVGNIVNKVIEGIMWVIRQILAIPFVKAIVDTTSNIIGGVSHGIGGAANWVNGIGESKDKSTKAEALKTATTNYWQVNVGSTQSFQAMTTRSANRSAGGYSPQSFPGGG